MVATRTTSKASGVASSRKTSKKVENKKSQSITSNKIAKCKSKAKNIPSLRHNRTRKETKPAVAKKNVKSKLKAKPLVQARHSRVNRKDKTTINVTGSTCAKIKSDTKAIHVVATKEEEREMKKIKQNEKDMKRIRQENAKRYKSNAGAIIHTGATSSELISSITTIPDKKSIHCATEATVLGDKIIKIGDAVDVVPDTSPGNNRPAGTGWVKKWRNVMMDLLQCQ